VTLDVLEWVESELAAARTAAAHAVDRAEALVALRSLALERAAELVSPTLTLEQLQDGFADEEERAHFTALAHRIATPEENDARAA
jgi:hypothetical protein